MFHINIFSCLILYFLHLPEKGGWGKWQYRSHRINQEKYIIRHAELTIINIEVREIFLVKSELQKNLDVPPLNFFFTKFGYQ